MSVIDRHPAAASLAAPGPCERAGGDRPRPRVIELVHTLRIGGTEMVVRDLVLRLRQEFRFTVLCLDSVGPLALDLEAEGVEVVCLGRRAGRDWGLVARLAREVRARGAHLVHAHQYTPFFYAAAARLFRGGPPLVLTEHGRHEPDVVSRERRLGNKLLALALDEGTAVAEFSRRALVGLDGIPAERVRVIPNGIDLARFAADADREDARRELGVPPRAPLVGHVGRLSPEKGQDVLLRAFAALAPSGSGEAPHLAIAGDGPTRDDLERLAGDLGLAPRVRFLGARRDVPRLLSAFDVFALPSRTEALPVAALEAMAAGIPVVATAVGGTPEVIRDGATGVLVPPGDPGPLAAALSTLLASPARARALALGGRRLVEARFSEEEATRSYRDLFRGLISHAGGRRRRLAARREA